MALFGMFSSDDAPTWREISALKRGGGEYQSLFSWQAEEYRRQGRRMIFRALVFLFLLLMLSLVPLLLSEEGTEGAKVFGRGAGALLLVLVVIVLARAVKSFRAASKIEEGMHT